jgi:hypothetical protein
MELLMIAFVAQRSAKKPVKNHTLNAELAERAEKFRGFFSAGFALSALNVICSHAL